MKFSKFFLSVFLLLLFSTPAMSITISPASHILETVSDLPQTFIIRVLNDGKDRSQFECYMSDLDINKKGNKIFKPVGTTSQSIAKYISIAEPRKFILDGKESREVVFTLKVPKGIIGGNKAIAFCQSSPLNTDKKDKKLIMAVRAGAVILQETLGTVYIKSRIKAADIILPDADKPLTVKLTVKNEGNTYLMSAGTATILGPNDYFVGSIELKKKLVFPGKEVELKGQLPIAAFIAPGIYHALITYQYRDKNISIDKVFTVK